MLRLITNNSPETPSTQEREFINVPVGITKDGTVVIIDAFHCNGVSYTETKPLTQEEVDERVENFFDDDARELWVESVVNGNTDESFEYFKEELERYESEEDLARIDSVLVPDSVKEMVEDHFEDDIAYFERVAWGTVFVENWAEDLEVVLDQELLDRALAHCKSKRKTKLTVM